MKLPCLQHRRLVAPPLYGLLTLLALGVGPLQAQTTKWVDAAGGSDANDGNTSGTAYATLQFAIDNSTSGTAGTPSVINVMDGTYGITGQTNTDGFDTAILIDGLDDLTIQAVAGHEPVVAPVTGVAASIVSISVQDCDGLLIDNIDSDQTIAQFDNWHVSTANDLTVRNCLFEGGEDGIDFNTDLTTALIEGNSFIEVNTGSGDEVLDFTDATYSDVVIQDNLFENNYRNITINPVGSASGFTIRRNTMDGTTSQEAIRLIGADDITIENNVIMNCMQQGVYIDTGCADINIWHNTFYNNDQEGLGQGEIRTKVLTADIVIKNNILSGNGANPAIETTALSLPGEDYNIVFDCVTPGYTFGASDIFSDPLFTDTTPGTEDLTPLAGSPALGAGTDLGLTDDVDGNPRPCPVATDPDIGAYEVGSCVVVVDMATLSLEADTCQQDQDAGKSGVQIEVELWLRNPDFETITGYQAFLEFDDGAMAYEGACSSYTLSPFESNIQPIATAEVTPGRLRLDGNSFVGTTGDALLATLVFTAPECTPVDVDWDETQIFDSEVSYIGVPLVTELVDSPDITPDDTPPVLTPCPDDITQPTDAGSSCTGAIVSWSDPTATDNCDPSPVVVCSPPSGSFFPVGDTAVTCTATDECGNESECMFTVTVTDTVLVNVTVVLTGSDPTARCIHFNLDSCAAVADHELVFSGTAPSISVASIEVPCGPWTTICAKDEQHTKWSGSSPLVLSGTRYTATTPLVLDGGDTDNDGDVDINDVTLFLDQFGMPTADGMCPWDGTRDADFSNSGFVLAEDYAFLVANWLTVSSSCCFLPTSGGGRTGLWTEVPVRDARTAAADLNGDGRVNVRDVEVFEQRHGLSGELSERMLASMR